MDDRAIVARQLGTRAACVRPRRRSLPVRPSRGDRAAAVRRATASRSRRRTTSRARTSSRPSRGSRLPAESSAGASPRRRTPSSPRRSRARPRSSGGCDTSSPVTARGADDGASLDSGIGGSRAPVAPEVPARARRLRARAPGLRARRADPRRVVEPWPADRCCSDPLRKVGSASADPIAPILQAAASRRIARRVRVELRLISALVSADLESARLEWEHAYRDFAEVARDPALEERVRMQLDAVDDGASPPRGRDVHAPRARGRVRARPTAGRGRRSPSRRPPAGRARWRSSKARRSISTRVARSTTRRDDARAAEPSRPRRRSRREQIGRVLLVVVGWRSRSCSGSRSRGRSTSVRARAERRRTSAR